MVILCLTGEVSVLEVIKIKYLRDYCLTVWFSDESVRVIDFEPYLDGEIYQPLKDVNFFKKVILDCGTTSWKNGADFAPEFLHKKGKTFKQAVSAKYTILASPEICKFEGIKIFINYGDHAPPHFHAKVGKETALINIKKCSLLEGSLPATKLKRVLLWAKERQTDLLKNWNLAVAKKPLEKIPPLKTLKKP